MLKPKNSNKAENMGDNDTTTIRPVFDEVTHILNSKISPDVIEYAHKRLYLIEDLYGDKANKTEILGNFMRRIPVIVWACSHGVEDAVKGPDATQNVIDLANTAWFNNKIVILTSCLCGKQLAPALVDAGARAVFAYDDELMIRVWSDTLDPLEGFKESITTPKLLYDGFKAKDVYAETIEEYNKWIDYWDEKDPATADVLRHDRDCFKLYGSGESRVALSTYVFMGLTDIFAIAWIILYSILNIVRVTKPLWKKT